MLNIALDTNILHEEGLDSSNMQILKILVDQDLVKIHIPSLVAREFQTKKIESLLGAINGIKSSISTAEKESRQIRKNIITNSSSFKELLTEIQSNIENDVTSSFNEWIKDFKVNLLEISDVNVDEIFDSYFNGNGVFKKAKDRSDIPDAFINSSLQKIKKELGFLIVIIKDNAFKKHLDNDSGFKTLDSLRILFKEEELKNIVQSNEKIKFIKSPEFCDQLLNFLNDNPRYFNDFYFDEGTISDTSILEVNHYGLNFEMYGYNNIDHLSILDVMNISNTKFSTTFSFQAEVSLSYVTDYGSYLKLERMTNRTPDMSSMNGDGMCDITEDAVVMFTTDLVIEFMEEPKDIENINLASELTTKNIVLNMTFKEIEIVNFVSS